MTKTSISLKTNKSDYRPDIDGLRAIAVSSVIFYHAGIEIFGGGFVGVDVFFVISGFLITSIIMKTEKEDGFSFIDFYERRARRIFPALFLMLFLCYLFALLVMVPKELNGFAKGLVSNLGFLSNIYFFKSANYFAEASEMNPLLHTWTLSVEEQFYFIFPPICFLLYRFNKNILFVLSVILLCSLSLSIWMSGKNSAANFYLLPFRAWELLAGAILVFIIEKYDPKQIRGWMGEVLFALGLLAILLSIFLLDSQAPFPGIYAMPVVFGTALCIFFGEGRKLSLVILANKPFVFMGLISYSAYLWHQPIFAFTRMLVPELSILDMLILSVVSLIVGWLSWRFVENGFRDKRKVSRNQIFGYSLISMSILLVLGGLMLNNSSELSRFKFGSKLSQYGGKSWEFGVTSKGESPKYFLYGDSHARQYAPQLNKMFKENGDAWISVLHSACLSFPNLASYYKKKQEASCIKHFESLLTLAREEPRVSLRVLIIAQRWGKELGINGELKRVGESEEASALLLASLEEAITVLHTEFDQIIILGNVPGSGAMKHGGYLKCLRTPRALCKSEFARSSGELAEFNESLSALAQKVEGVQFVNPYVYLCFESKCMETMDSELIYSDHAHLSRKGASLVVNGIESILYPAEVSDNLITN